MLRCTLSALACLGAVLGAGDVSPDDLVGISEQLSGSLVKVGFHLRYDKGESPGEVDVWRTWRQVSFQFEHDWEEWEELIREERPAERGGFLVEEDIVVTGDPMIHPRFIRAITVGLGGQVVEAKPQAFGAHDDVLYLELAEPLAGGSPLRFDPSRERPYFAVTFGRWDGSWRTSVEAFGVSLETFEDGRRYLMAPAHALLVDRSGTPVGFTGLGKIAVDDSWKGGPGSRPTFSASQLESARERVRQLADRSFLRVALSFRSPPSSEMSEYDMWDSDLGDDDSETEWNGLGVLVEDDLVLVLANFKPKKTGRLERIRVFTAGVRAVNAAFAGTLVDYGGFLARLETPLEGRARFVETPIAAARDRLLVKAEVAVFGETRVAHYGRERITFLYTGRGGRVYPAVAPTTPIGGYYYGSGAEAHNFLFAPDGRLVALPLALRQKVSVEDEWSDDTPLMTPAVYVTELLADHERHLDPDNRPLTEEEENRLAWLGLELQPMDPNLARANRVSHQTTGGTTGALVTYVYAGSPAEEAGVEVGDILLRLHVEGHPKPLVVDLSEEMHGMMAQFPWEFLDQIPQEYFEELPAPWGSVESSLTRSLTDLGFGTLFTAEVFRDGGTLSMDLEVTQGPPHYDAAKRYKNEDLGLTVRDATYEVRRYFQMGPDDPGVVISKIEPGGKAAIAGLRPYEMITGVGDGPTLTVADLEKAVSTPGEHRLLVKRLAEGRIVRVETE